MAVRMRVLCLANNWLGWQVLESVKHAGDDVVALVLHPSGRRSYGEEILATAGLDASRVFDATRLDEPATREAIAAAAPEIGLSVMFGYVLRPAFLDAMPCRFVNLHPALLPWNRGAHPNVWSIVDGTPAGATLHAIDAGIDTGDIIAQRPVEVAPIDTGETLYRKLEQAALDLFRDNWPLIRAGRESRTPQSRAEGSFHRAADLDRIDEIDPERSYRAGALIDLLRARTFPPHRGAWFRAGGRKIHVRIQLIDEEAEDGETR
jgi:methionyl-tRNA formyltransferase